VEHIDLSLGKLPGADAALKQDIELSKGSVLGLGESEVGVDEAQECDTALQMVSIFTYRSNQSLTYPEEAGEVAPVPGRGVEHVRSKNTVDNSNHVAVAWLAI
jgi:hypothetical protein